MIAKKKPSEVEELRAKLAVADRRWAESADLSNKLAGKCVEWERREIELEAKLAEAEGTNARTVAELEYERRGYELVSKRAEAAEARVREYENRLPEGGGQR